MGNGAKVEGEIIKESVKREGSEEKSGKWREAEGK